MLLFYVPFVYEALNSHTKSSYRKENKTKKKRANEKAKKHEVKLVSIGIGHRNPKFMKQFVRFTYEITCSAPPLKALYCTGLVLVSLYFFYVIHFNTHPYIEVR